MTPDDVRKLISKLTQSAHGDELFEQAMNELPLMEQFFHTIMALSPEEEIRESAQRGLAIIRDVREAYHRGGRAAVKAWAQERAEE